MTATTSLTAQNTQGVQDVHITPPSFVEKQIRAVMEDGFLEGEGGVVKIGMYALPRHLDKPLASSSRKALGRLC